MNTRKGCEDCGTLLERNGVCPNCDQEAFMLDWQSGDIGALSEQFLDRANVGHERAKKRSA